MDTTPYDHVPHSGVLVKIHICIFAGMLVCLCLLPRCGGGNTSTGPVHPVNGKIAYARNEVSLSGVFMSPETDIWLMDPDGSNQQNLTKGNAMSYGPTWSPDGKRIADYSDV